MSGGAMNLIDSYGDSTKKLQIKRLAVVATLDKLPATQHDVMSFTVDAFVLPPVAGCPQQLCKVMMKGRLKVQRACSPAMSAWLWRRLRALALKV
eukprot:2052287-Rhodomonas_salina.1